MKDILKLEDKALCCLKT